MIDFKTKVQELENYAYQATLAELFKNNVTDLKLKEPIDVFLEDGLMAAKTQITDVGISTDYSLVYKTDDTSMWAKFKNIIDKPSFYAKLYDDVMLSLISFK